MKILLIGNYLDDEQESMQRFTTLMHEGLTRAGHQAKVIRPTAFIRRLNPGFAGLSKWLGYVDKFVIFPILLRSAARWADVIHICDHSNAMYTRYVHSRPYVVTCHDMLAIRSALGEIPQNRTSWTGRQFQRMILDGLKCAQHLACDSQCTKGDITRIACIKPERISVVEIGLNYPYTPMPPEDATAHLITLGIPKGGPFLFHIGGNAWYKNRLGVLQIFACLLHHSQSSNLRLIMAGKSWTPAMCQFVHDKGLEGSVIRLGKVSNEELRALYSAATALLFPSLQEGFGWPIIEAQACGCPVITSNRAPMNDVGGNAAIYIDPENSCAAADVISKSLMTINQLRSASIANAARFNTSAMIRNYVTIYETLDYENSPRH